MGEGGRGRREDGGEGVDIRKQSWRIQLEEQLASQCPPTLFTAVPHEPWRAAALPGDVVAGRASRTVAALRAASPVRARQTR